MSEFVGYTPEDKSNNNLQSRVDKVAGLVSHLMNTSNSDEEAWIKRAGIFQEIQTEIGYGFRKVEDLLLVQNDNNKTDEQKKLAEEAEELLVLGTAKALMGGDIQDKEAIGVGSVMKIKERLPEELKGLEKKVRDSVIDEPEIQKILDPLDIVRKRAAKAGETGQKVLEDQVNKAQEKLILLEVDSTKEDQLGMVVEWLGEEGNGFKNTGRDIDMAEDYEDYIEQARRRSEFDGKRYGDVEGFDRVSGVQLPPEFMNGMRELRENDIDGAKKIIATTFVKMSENPLFFASWWQQNTASQVETILNSSLGYTNLSSNETERKNYQEIQNATLIEVRNKFAPELLNRFTAIIVFNPLSIDNLKEITKLMLNRVKIMAKEKGIEIDFKPELIEELIKKGYSPEWGARPLARVIEDSVESYIALKLLKKEINPGDRIMLGNEVFDI